MARRGGVGAVPGRGRACGSAGSGRTTSLRRRVLRLAGIAAASLALAMLLPNRLNWRSDSPYLESLTGVANYKEGSGAGRLVQYGNTLRMAADHPVLGVGPGNWPVHYPRYMSPGDPSYDADDIIPTNPWPSSDWMAMLSERGVPGLLLLVLVGASLALGAWARVRRGSRHTPALTDLTIVATSSRSRWSAASTRSCCSRCRHSSPGPSSARSRRPRGRSARSS